MKITKTEKLELRLTKEQIEWVQKQANKETIGRSTYIRKVIEELRRKDLEGKSN